MMFRFQVQASTTCNQGRPQKFFQGGKHFTKICIYFLHNNLYIYLCIYIYINIYIHISVSGRLANQRSHPRYPKARCFGVPVRANETTDIVAKDAFIEAMRDKELALKVREREPRTIDEAY